MTETAVQFATPEGIADGYIYRPAGSGRWPGILFFPDAFGVRDANRKMAERLAQAEFVVLLTNPYYRNGPAQADESPGELVDPAFLHERYGKKAASIGGGLLTDLRSQLDFLIAHDSVAPGELGCTGYCMGGNFALTAAGNFPELSASACFHGGGLAVDLPQSPHRRAHAIRGEVYVAVAEIDPYLAPGETARLRGALEGAAVTHTVEIYEGAEHGFTLSDLPCYNEAAAERHWVALIKLLKGVL